MEENSILCVILEQWEYIYTLRIYNFHVKIQLKFSGLYTYLLNTSIFIDSFHSDKNLEIIFTANFNCYHTLCNYKYNYNIIIITL